MKNLVQMVYYAIAIICLKGVSFVMLPLVTGNLSQAQYGELNILVSLSAVLSIVFACGTAELLFRFASSDNSKKFEFESLLTSLLWLSLGLCFFLLFVAGAAAEQVASWLPVSVNSFDVSLLFISLGGNILLVVPLAYHRHQNHAQRFMVLTVTQGVCQALVCYSLLNMGLKVSAVMLASVCSSWLVATFLLLFFYPKHLHFRFQLPAQHRRYMAAIVLSGLCLYGLNGAEHWLLASFEGKSTLAVYFAAGQFSLIVSLAIEPFRMWWFPRRFQTFERSPQDAAKFAVVGVQLQSLMISGMLMLGPLVMSWMLPESYGQSAELLPLMCIIVLFRAYAELFNLGCYLRSDARFVPLINGGCALLALTLGYFLVPLYGLFAMVLVLIGVAAIRASLFIAISQMLTPLNYPILPLVFSGLVLALQTLVSYQDFIWWSMVPFVLMQAVLLLKTSGLMDKLNIKVVAMGTSHVKS